MKKSWKSFMTVTAAAAAMTAAMAFSSLAAVAKVGTNEFNNLQDAINSAGESPVVIDLEENVSLTDGLVIGAGKKCDDPVRHVGSEDDQDGRKGNPHRRNL